MEKVSLLIDKLIECGIDADLMTMTLESGAVIYTLVVERYRQVFEDVGDLKTALFMLVAVAQKAKGAK